MSRRTMARPTIASRLRAKPSAMRKPWRNRAWSGEDGVSASRYSRQVSFGGGGSERLSRPIERRGSCDPPLAPPRSSRPRIEYAVEHVGGEGEADEDDCDGDGAARDRVPVGVEQRVVGIGPHAGHG